LCSLTANRKAFSVTQAAIAADVHEALDAQLNFRLEHTFDLVLFGNDGPDGIGFLVCPILYLFVPIDVGFSQDFLGRSSANTETVGKTYLTSFVIRYINTCYACHVILVSRVPDRSFIHRLSLSLFIPRILFVDDVQFSLPPDDLAIRTALLDGCLY